MAEGGQKLVDMQVVLAFFATPILALPSLAQTAEESWLTCSEYMERAGCNRNFLEKKLQRYGGMNRLQHWSTEGLARQTSVWLIHPDTLPQSNGGTGEEVRRRPTAADEAPTAAPGTGASSKKREKKTPEAQAPAAAQETGSVPTTPTAQSIYDQLTDKKGKQG
jgi:hypothetical protein